MCMEWGRGGGWAGLGEDRRGLSGRVEGAMAWGKEGGDDWEGGVRVGHVGEEEGKEG